MVFPVVMYGCESWTIKKTEHWRIDAFELWCWRRLLRVPWIARRSNWSTLKEINPWKDWCWSWNSDTLATWCEELTHLKRPWSWERLRVGGEGDNRGWDGWMASLTRWTWVWVNSRSWWWTGRPGVLWFMGLQRVKHDWLNWTECHRDNEAVMASIRDSMIRTNLRAHGLLTVIWTRWLPWSRGPWDFALKILTLSSTLLIWI